MASYSVTMMKNIYGLFINYITYGVKDISGEDDNFIYEWLDSAAADCGVTHFTSISVVSENAFGTCEVTGIKGEAVDVILIG